MAEWNRDGRGAYDAPGAYGWTDNRNESYESAPPRGYYGDPQYVGFNEFIGQLQGSRQYGSGNYGTAYPPGLYGEPSVVNGSNLSQAAPQYDPNGPPKKQYSEGTSASASAGTHDNIYFNSNLTPTATEFVPKSAQASLVSAIENPNVNVTASASTEPRGKKKNFKSKERIGTEHARGTGDAPAVSKILLNSETRNRPAQGGSNQNNSAPISEKEGSRKSNNKNKNKKMPVKPTNEDVGRTFYNSSANKPSSSQDVRSKNQDVRYSDTGKQDGDSIRDKQNIDSNGREYNSREHYNRENSSSDNYTRNTFKGRDINKDNNSKESGHRENYKASGSRDNLRESNNRDNSKDNPSQDNIKDSSKRDNFRDGSKRDNFKESAKRDNFRDGSNQNNFGDNSKRDNISDSSNQDNLGESTNRDNFKDSSKQGNFRDISKRDNFRDDSYRDNFRDGSNRNNFRDSSNRDNYRDGSNRDNYRDGSNRDNFRDGSNRDNFRDGSNRDNFRDRSNRDNFRDNSNRDNFRDSSSRDNFRENRNRDGYKENRNRDGFRENGTRDNFRENSNRDSFYGRDSGARNNYGRDNYSDGFRENRDNYNRKSHGSARFQRLERNAADDEEYANSYLTYREDRQDSRRPVQSEKIQLVQASPAKKPARKPAFEKEENLDMTQRERLSEQLDKGVLECLVCCEHVRQVDQVWSCGNCYHVLHLRCIRKWAMSSIVEGKWRCPACQNTNDEVPTEYLCFCGAMRAPEWIRGGSGAHTCGERCRRPRSCPHPCSLPCHPGPCPPCQASLNKKCGCGAETRAVVCSSKLEQVCGRTCGRKLTCGVHFCTLSCHEGPCAECKETLSQECYCPAGKSRVVECTEKTAGKRSWACGEQCGRVLACGTHVCRAPCHAPPCDTCKLLPDKVLTCPCGKMRLTEKEKRSSCLDPIPLCGNICAKPLTCGPPNDKHFCKVECHDGPCPPCPDKTVMNCRCGHTSRDVPCVDMPAAVDNVYCAKKCNKKMSCGRHRCRELCCALETHRCPQVCARMLSCGLHRCDNLCHTGHCPQCGRLGFTELTCECGESVLLPPVACGARPPPCNRPCTRRRLCGHPPHHSCHSDDCPPCVVLTTKRCYGGHEERKTIPCHQEEFSCGLPCGKPLPCGKHTCTKLCHTGECTTAKCVQACMEKRPSCGHPCGAPCHIGEESPCPSSVPCRLIVRATCPCKRKFMEKACADNAKDFAKVMSTMVASKMQDGSALDMSELNRPGANLKTLECDDECSVEQRTKRMALVLQIRNPDTSSKLAPRYSEHVRQWASRDPAFATAVHDKLTELVQLAKKSKQKTRSHSFPSMNHQKRQFVHELCEHFGCESVAYDAEPNRNVVATADKEKSWLPAMSVLEVLGRESGKGRRVPGPVLRPAVPSSSSYHYAPTPSSSTGNKSSSGWATLTSSRTNAWGNRSAPPAQPSPRPPPRIDYFNNPPDN